MIIRRPAHVPNSEKRRLTPAEIFDALDFARKQAMFRGSPDFLRQQVGEDRVQRLIARLLASKPRSRVCRS